PIKNESPEVAEHFRRFAGSGESELIVADGGGGPATSQRFQEIGARLVHADLPRGARLARAAREARGEILFFLHADSVPPDNALDAIREALANGAAAGAFSLAYQGFDARLRWIAWWANLRSRLLGLPFGDQGLFCRRDAYDRAGGFSSLPVCDDVDLVRRLKRSGRLVIRPERTRTSPRRYRERGALRQVLRHWRVLAGYFAGVSPEKLERWYNGK
ncbi:MAG: TIGR04283 family arsenosugar biosynthesis glycosyltransferase, partial [Thermoanaerobaculia bacterium]